MTNRWYIVHAYSNFENKVADSIREQAKQRGLVRPVRGDPGAEGEGHRGAARPQGRCRAQVLPRLRAGEDGADRRGLSPDQEHAEGDRLPRRRQQADADVGGRGAAHPAPGAGRHRAAEAVGRRSRSASRCACPTARSPRSTARWRKSTRAARGSRSRCRSSAAPRRSNWNSGRSRRYCSASMPVKPGHDG